MKKQYKAFLGGNIKPYSVNIDAETPEDVVKFIRERHHDVDMFTEILVIDRETKAAVYSSVVPLRGMRGRPSKNIDAKIIYDALKQYPDVKTAAAALGVSRAYIYKVAGVDKVREIMTLKARPVNEKNVSKDPAAARKKGQKRPK
jgi:hypothetical protein